MRRCSGEFMSGEIFWTLIWTSFQKFTSKMLQRENWKTHQWYHLYRRNKTAIYWRCSQRYYFRLLTLFSLANAFQRCHRHISSFIYRKTRKTRHNRGRPLMTHDRCLIDTLFMRYFCFSSCSRLQHRDCNKMPSSSSDPPSLSFLPADVSMQRARRRSRLQLLQRLLIWPSVWVRS